MVVFNKKFTFRASGVSRRSFDMTVCGVPVGAALDVRGFRGGFFRKRVFDVDVFFVISDEFKDAQIGVSK